MKTKNLLTVLVILTYSVCISMATAQEESNNNEMKPFEIKPTTKGEFEKNINGVFLRMLESAEYPKDKMCVSAEIFKLANDEMKKIITEGKGFIEDYHFLSDEYKKMDLFTKYENYDIDRLAKKYDKGSFKTFESRLSHARANNNTFISFVFAITGKDVGQLKDDDLDSLKYAYEDRSGRSGVYNVDGAFKKLNENCDMEVFANYYIKEVSYPNVVSEFYITVDIYCKCDDKGKIKLKKSNYQYVAEVNGIRTDKSHIYKVPSRSKINVKSVECCPGKEKEKESKTALDDDNGYFEVSAHVGLPLGDEKDFYSLNIGANAVYLFNLSEHFSTGVGAGYTHFTPKEFTVGSTTFKGEGISYVPIFGVAQYDLTENINLRGTVGYALSTDNNVDGGLNYSVGIGWNPIPGLTIRPELDFISLGEDRHFNSFRVRVSRSW